jgi:hypothetical protein
LWPSNARIDNLQGTLFMPYRACCIFRAENEVQKTIQYAVADITPGKTWRFFVRGGLRDREAEQL